MQSAPARDGAIASDVRVCGQARYTNTSSIQRLLDKEEELETELVNFHSKLMLNTFADVLKHKNRTWWSPFSRATSFGYLHLLVDQSHLTPQKIIVWDGSGSVDFVEP